MREYFLSQAALLAQSINPDRVHSLSFTPADATNETYLRLCRQLTAAKQAMRQERVYCLAEPRHDTAELTASYAWVMFGRTYTAVVQPGAAFLAGHSTWAGWITYRGQNNSSPGRGFSGVPHSNF
jgi:hypothetical protein